jgi:hypothetical protein
MFNDESTHKERQQVLQSLMAKGAGDVGSGVHTPREINQLLARTDAEFRTFQQVKFPSNLCTNAPALTAMGTLCASPHCASPCMPTKGTISDNV